MMNDNALQEYSEAWPAFGHGMAKAIHMEWTKHNLMNHGDVAILLEALADAYWEEWESRGGKRL